MSGSRWSCVLTAYSTFVKTSLENCTEVVWKVLWDCLTVFCTWLKGVKIYKLTSHEKKNWSKSQKVREILKILWIWNFAMTGLMKMAENRSIFEIDGSSFGFFLIFMCLRNHILNFRLYNLQPIFNFFRFFNAPLGGGSGKK